MQLFLPTPSLAITSYGQAYEGIKKIHHHPDKLVVHGTLRRSPLDLRRCTPKKAILPPPTPLHKGECDLWIALTMSMHVSTP